MPYQTRPQFLTHVRSRKKITLVCLSSINKKCQHVSILKFEQLSHLKKKKKKKEKQCRLVSVKDLKSLCVRFFFLSYLLSATHVAGTPRLSCLTCLFLCFVDFCSHTQLTQSLSSVTYSPSFSSKPQSRQTNIKVSLSISNSQAPT